MEGDYIKISNWLLPLSWLYGCGVRLRNFLFDVGVLKSQAFDIPVISVGNITVGGTGKTPHVEYLIRLLHRKVRVAVLSRGYKRKSKGFVVATDETDAREIGDEPLQMKRKFRDITVAVCKKRVEGIQRLVDQDKELDVVLLDDAFQHRYVKPGINILLVDYHRLIIYDKLLPAGRLREPLKGKDRADVVIVTKCPRDMRPMEYRVITKAMDLFPYQHLYFTTIGYEPLRPLYHKSINMSHRSGSDLHVLLLAGIASPRQMMEDLSTLTPHITSLCFPDHHSFSGKDYRRINETFASLPQPRCIITTEKDAARLADGSGLSEEARQAIYVLPVSIKFMQDQANMFNEYILGYVRKNSRNSILVKGKDDNKSQDSHRAGDRTRTISFRNH